MKRLFSHNHHPNYFQTYTPTYINNTEPTRFNNYAQQINRNVRSMYEVRSFFIFLKFESVIYF